MKPLLIAGNWKSNKTISEAMEWLKKLSAIHSTIVLCVSYTLLYVMKQEIDRLKLSLQLGAQDVSPFDEGAYTGEVTARMVKEVADWVIIGHSERRKYFSETDEMLKNKVDRARSAGLKVIYCVSDDTTPVPAGVDVVAYEPVWAIGTGKTETPATANTVISSIKTKTEIATVIYGGSVTAENVASFIAEPSIDGVLPGGASLDPEKFSRLVAAAVCIEK